MTQRKIRLSKSHVGARETDAVKAVLERAYLGMGEDVRLFEEELKAFIGEPDRHVVCVSSGTSALHLACAALDLGSGDEVLVPSLTFVASFQAISASGATPVACDVSQNSAFIDLKDAEKRMTARTRAIMPVHYASDSSGMAGVYNFAQRNGLRVIEDAAHSFGSVRDGTRIGATGDIICFSFDGIKNITCGEGGAIVTGDSVVAERLKDSRLLGVEKDTDARFKGERSWSFDVTRQGFRYHMSNIMAAIGRTQLEKFSVMAEKRQFLQNIYLRELKACPFVTPLKIDYRGVVPHIMVVVVQDNKREILRNKLSAVGIETGIHYQPNHLLTKYRTPHSLPNAERLGNEILSLPIHPEVTEEDVLFICENIKLAFSR